MESEGYCRNGEGPTLLYLNFLGETFIRNQGEYFRRTFVKMKNENILILKNRKSERNSINLIKLSGRFPFCGVDNTIKDIKEKTSLFGAIGTDLNSFIYIYKAWQYWSDNGDIHVKGIKN